MVLGPYATSHHKTKYNYSWQVVPGEPGPCETELCTLPDDIQDKTCRAIASYTSPPNVYVDSTYKLKFARTGYGYKAELTNGSQIEEGQATIMTPPVYAEKKGHFWEVSYLVGLRIPNQPVTCKCQIMRGGGDHPITQSDWPMIVVPDEPNKTLWELCSPWLVMMLPLSQGHCPRYNRTASVAWRGYTGASTEVLHCEREHKAHEEGADMKEQPRRRLRRGSLSSRRFRASAIQH